MKTDTPETDAAAEDGMFYDQEKPADFARKLERERDTLRDTIAKMEYNHRYEREKMARVIRRLVRYADRVAERHPKAVTIHGQNARVEGGIWLAEFDRQNAESIRAEIKP